MRRELLGSAGAWERAAATQHHARRSNARIEAAVRIQRIFRGWRTRRRVVWLVREELSAFMVAVEQDVEVERVLMGLPRPQTSRWMCDGEDSRSEGAEKMLHLPRIEDNIFGLRFSFPLPQPTAVMQPTDSVSRDEEADEGLHVRDDSHEQSAGDLAIVDESMAIEEQPQAEAAVVGETEDQSSSRAENLSEVDADSTTPLSVCTDQDTHSAEPLYLEPSSHSPIYSDAHFAVVKEASSSAELTVKQILATHSKADILMEIQWAKQSLRDRLRYLGLRHRS